MQHKLIHVATNGIPKFLFFTSPLILDINHFVNFPNLIEKHISLFDLYTAILIKLNLNIMPFYESLKCTWSSLMDKMVLFHRSVYLQQENNRKLGKNTEIKVFHIENRFLVKCHETVVQGILIEVFSIYFISPQYQPQPSPPHFSMKKKVTDLRNF